MSPIVRQLFRFFAHLGGFGLLTLGMLDSSFLFLPFGNDLLMIAMTARRRHLLPYFALMATVGSVLGCALTDLIGRKGGEEGLAKRASPKRFEYVTDKIKKNAGWALAFASLMPLPFPFTSFGVSP